MFCLLSLCSEARLPSRQSTYESVASFCALDKLLHKDLHRNISVLDVNCKIEFVASPTLT